MLGFDNEFTDLPDYIVKITERIWEGRGIGLIRRYYSDDNRMHTSAGPSEGLAPVIRSTVDTLNAFPDRQLLPEDIVWSGDEVNGYLSSHRIISTATHLGAGVFGPPTGRALQFRGIADCFCLRNQITEEWLVRDQSGMCAQIGVDPAGMAQRLAEAEMARGDVAWHVKAAETLRREGGFRPPVLQEHSAAVLVRQTLEALWNRTDLAAVAQVYHRAARADVPGNRTLYGHEPLTRWLFGMLSALPDAKLIIEHSIALEEPGLPVRVATRWWLTGTHSGAGVFGPPSGATVLVLGITHSHVAGGRIIAEWTVFDEVAVLKQIALARG